MIYDRETQWKFLEDELAAEVEEYDKKLKTTATFLLDKGELFTAQFLSFSESGEMRVRFAISRPLPRKGEYLYCMTLHKELRNHLNWGERKYGDLVKEKTNFTLAICNWISPASDPRFMLAGFIGIETEFYNWIKDTPGVVLVFGPNKPPYEYMAHLQNVVSNRYSEALSSILDVDYFNQVWKPSLIPDSEDISGFIRNSFELSDTMIIQGPPGTGKTFQLANLCRSLCSDNKSVLVTALTNRALMELAGKDAMKSLIDSGNVYKTKITTDESKEVPGLVLEKAVSPKPGGVVLSTFYISSGVAADLTSDYPFDYVIVDEASQAILPMIAAARRLGRKALFVGDIKQLAPVMEMKEDRIERRNYHHLLDGLKSITERSLFPVFQLTATRRLSATAAEYTGMFYSNTLQSKATTSISNGGLFFLREDGGPCILKTDVAVGEPGDEACVKLATIVAAAIRNRFPKKEIAVLSCLKETVRPLQKSIRMHIKDKNILVDTVARIQGLTTHFCIYVVPNTHYNRTLDPRLFNVATSRAINQTIIISDKDILAYSRMKPEVRDYLTRLNSEASFYMPYNRSKSSLLTDKGLLLEDDLRQDNTPLIE